MKLDNNAKNFIDNNQMKVDLLVQRALENKSDNKVNENNKASEFDDIDELNRLSEMYLGKRIFVDSSKKVKMRK